MFVELKLVVSTVTFSAALYVIASPVLRLCSVDVMVSVPPNVVVLIVMGSGSSKYAVIKSFSPPDTTISPFSIVSVYVKPS